jgi:hypothetical protein
MANFFARFQGLYVLIIVDDDGYYLDAGTLARLVWPDKLGERLQFTHNAGYTVYPMDKLRRLLPSLQLKCQSEQAKQTLANFDFAGLARAFRAAKLRHLRRQVNNVAGQMEKITAFRRKRQRVARSVAQLIDEVD